MTRRMCALPIWLVLVLSAIAWQPALAAQEPGAPSVLYLDRCTGGCTITAGPDDATTHTSVIAGAMGSYPVPEFVDGAGNSGTAADAEWNAIVECVTQLYAPYNVTITDQRPAAGTAYNLTVVAGSFTDLGGTNGGALSVSSGPSMNCTKVHNLVSFVFPVAHSTGADRVNQLCSDIGNASGVQYGLDHILAFQDGTQACTDPMGWVQSCGGRKFFRDKVATCGETAARSCICGASLNPHQTLLETFGPGMSTPPPPTSVVTLPTAGADLGAVVAVNAGALRGVARVELFLNGTSWAEVPGAAFGANGQANPGSYTITVPDGVPDSVIDIVARAYDDLGTFADSEPVTVTKGPAGGCTSADTCADGQVCDDGRCYWDPPVGELGDTCTFDRYCASGLCSPTVSSRVCTVACTVGDPNGCPDSSTCVPVSGDQGFCSPVEDSGGCCSSSGGGAAGNGAFALVLATLLGRRRRLRRRV